MSKTRLEAFSDGVIAIIITIMVLELHVPKSASLAALGPVLPVFLTYVLSYIFIGIYWNNHHHMFHAVEHVTGGILWANLHLLFWLSLVPFVTGWMGENDFEAVPTAGYGIVMLGAAVAYTILQTTIVRHPHAGAKLKEAVGSDLKGKLSLVCYGIAIPVAFWKEWIADALYVFVAALWLVPDRRIERMMG